MIHHEHEFEASRGLPERLPPGEVVLWQGAPDWRSLAHRVFHVRMIAFYCVILLIWRVAAVFYDGGSLVEATVAGLWLGAFFLSGLGLLALLAYAHATTTVYTLTNRRVVLRYGVAFPIALNIPFRIIQTAGLKPLGNGFGDIALSLKGPDRMAYLSLWPHARPWRFNPAEPTLRSIPEAERVGQLLAHAAATPPARSQESGDTQSATGALGSEFESVGAAA